MVINSTNINKTKESLNNDGHQFSFIFVLACGLFEWQKINAGFL
jgi:hypothetical protein